MKIPSLEDKGLLKTNISRASVYNAFISSSTNKTLNENKLLTFESDQRSEHIKDENSKSYFHNSL